MGQASILSRLKWRVQGVFDALGYDRTNWLRVEQVNAWSAFLEELRPSAILEISPGWNSCWQRFGNYESVQFPAFDICQDVLSRQFDAVIADQVLEHVPNPLSAVRNIRAMLAPNGTALIATPFLFRVHGRPFDFHRWTEAGLRLLLREAGFEDERIASSSWGNAACVRAHTKGPVKDFGWGRDLSNDPEYPLVVWAFAQK